MKVRPLISICIPTYNGGEFFLDTLQSIVPYLSEQVELVISDNMSQDETYERALVLQAQNCYVNAYQNNKNLGMDRNFTIAARRATGKYVWFCGADDLLGKEVISNVLSILENNNISILNVNFSQYNHDMTKCITPSFFARASFEEYSHYQAQDLIIFKNSKEYFKIFTQSASFLPAVVMRREYWDTDQPSQFYGTHFVQLGVLLSNMDKGDIGAFTKPLIKGRIPDNQWQANGEKLFSVMCGDLKAKKIAFRNNKLLPKYIYSRDLFRFTINYPFFLMHCKAKGFKKNSTSYALLRSIYGNGWLYWILIYPLTTMPISVLSWLLWPVGKIKKLLLQFKVFDNLRS
jgi:glycosyltransferase involved in cell wall biosynthesis